MHTESILEIVTACASVFFFLPSESLTDGAVDERHGKTGYLPPCPRPLAGAALARRARTTVI